MSGDVNVACNLLDSEVLKVESVLREINQKTGKSVNLEGFRKEIIGRFEDIGLKVQVRAYTSNEDGVYPFDIDIVDHCERKAFDYDRQVHEVTTDILDLGTKGVIKSGPILSESVHKH